MAIGAITVDAKRVAYSPKTRLDVRYHWLAELVNPFLDGLKSCQPLDSVVSRSGNGANIPASSYADALEDADALYVSVGALSQFALRPANCTPLLTSGDRVKGTSLKLEDVATANNEVLLTRSGTPGIAWPGCLAPDGLPTVPSGFLIRLAVTKWDTVALSAILNHPVWRLRSLALSAGKRQDNIGKGALADIPVPLMSSTGQAALAEMYGQTLADIDTIANEDRLAETCNRIIARVCDLQVPAIATGSVAARVVRMHEVASAPTMRADNRWHGVANQQVLAALERDSITLGSVLASPPAKGRQPTYLEEPDGGDAFAIATSTLQMGQLVLENAKPVTRTSVASAPVSPGRLLVAMDGDGSLGKAAVVPDTDLSLMRDSHVAMLETKGSEHLAAALACWLNSTWGLTQTSGLMTGATGQTQLRPADLASVRVSVNVLKRAAEVSTEYKSALSYIDTPARRARKILCNGAAQVSELLLKHRAIHLSPERSNEFVSATRMWELLGVAYPTVR
jgi:hypothetical protein